MDGGNIEPTYGSDEEVFVMKVTTLIFEVTGDV